MNADDIFEQMISKKSKRGQKQCPECRASVGVRTIKCKCGHEFAKRTHKLTQRELDAEQDKATDEERLYAMCVRTPGGRFVYAASGRSSVKLDEINLDTVSDYCNQAVFDGIQKGGIYTPSAIRGLLMHDLGYNSEEYRQACKYVNEWYNRVLGIDVPSGEKNESN